MRITHLRMHRTQRKVRQGKVRGGWLTSPWATMKTLGKWFLKTQLFEGTGEQTEAGRNKRKSHLPKNRSCCETKFVWLLLWAQATVQVARGSLNSSTKPVIDSGCQTPEFGAVRAVGNSEERAHHGGSPRGKTKFNVLKTKKAPST